MINKLAHLKAGLVTGEEFSVYQSLRRQEVLAEARKALGERASGLTDENILSLFYHEISGVVFE